MTIDGAGAISVDGAAAKVFSGIIGGTTAVGNLTIDSAQTGAVTFQNAYTGAGASTLTTTAGGTGVVSFNGTTAIPGTVTVATGTTVTFGSSGTITTGAVDNTGIINYNSTTTAATADITNNTGGVLNFGASSTGTYALAIQDLGTVNVTGAGAATFSSPIGGTTPAGNIVLAGTNTGGTTFSNTVALDGTSTITVNSPSSLSFTSNDTNPLTVAGGILNTGTVNFNGDGSAIQTYTAPIDGAGAINIDLGAGTNSKTFALAAAMGGTTPVGAITITSGNTDTVTFNNPVTGASVTNNNASGLVTFANDVTLSGALTAAASSQTTFSTGVVTISGASTAGTGSTITLAGTGATEFTAGLSASAAATLAITGASLTPTYTGDITGPFAVNISGAGTKTFNNSVGTSGSKVGAIDIAASATNPTTFGAVNSSSTFTNNTASGQTNFGGATSFDGAVTIAGGSTVELTSTTASAYAAASTTVSGAGTSTFNFNSTSGDATYTSTFDGDGTVTFDINVAGASTSKTFAGVIGGTNAVGTIAINTTNTGTTLFSNAVTADQFTTDAASGVVTFADVLTLNTSLTNPGSIVLQSQISSPGTLTNNGNLTFAPSAPQTHSGTIAGAGAIVVQNASVTTFSSPVTNVTFDTNNSGAATFASGATAIFSGAATVATGTTLTIEDYFQAASMANTGTVNFNTAAAAVYPTTGTMPITGAGAINVESGTDLKQFTDSIGTVGTPVTSITINSNNTGQVDFQDGVYAVAFTNSKTAGIVQLLGDTTFSGSSTTAAGSTLEIDGDAFDAGTTTGLSGAGNLGFGGNNATQTIDGTINMSGSGIVAITGNANKTFNGTSGSLTFGGAMTKDANASTTIFSGAVTGGATFTNVTASGLTTFNGATSFVGAVTNPSTAGITIGAGFTASGGIVNTGGLLTFAAAGPQTYSTMGITTAIPGSGNITVSGGGTGLITLGSAIGTTVNYLGDILIGAGNTQGTTFSGEVFADTLTMTAGAGAATFSADLNLETTLTIPATTQVNIGAQLVDNSVGTMAVSNAGTLSFTGTGTHSGVYTGAGAISISTGAGANTFSTAISQGTLTTATGAGVTTFSNNLTLTGAATIGASTVVTLGAGFNVGSAANSGTLNFNSTGAETYVGNINGTGTIAVDLGTSGTKAFTGTIGATTPGPISVAATNTSAVNFDAATNGTTYTASNGAGTVTFNAPTSFSGAVTNSAVTANALTITDSFAASSGIASTGRVNFAAANGLQTYAMSITGDGDLSVTLGTADSKTFTGAINVAAVDIAASNTASVLFGATPAATNAVSGTTYTSYPTTGQVTFNAPTTFTGAVVNDSTSTTLTIANDFTATGNIANGGALAFTDPGTPSNYTMNITGNGTIALSPATGFTYTFTGDIGDAAVVRTGAMTFGANGGDVVFTAAGTIGGTTYTDSVGSGSTTFNGATDFSGNVTINSTVNIGANTMTVASPNSLVANTASSIINFTAAGSHTVPITATTTLEGTLNVTGSGAVVLNESIGTSTTQRFGDIFIGAANGSTTFGPTGSVFANSIDLTAGNSTVTFSSPIDLATQLAVGAGDTVNIGGSDFTITAGILNNGTINFTPTTAVTYDIDITTTASGNGVINVTGAGATTIDGDIGVSGTEMGLITVTSANTGGTIFGANSNIFTTDVAVQNGASLDIVSGNVNILSPGKATLATGSALSFSATTGAPSYAFAIDGQGTITLSGGSTSKTFTGDIGAITAVGTITIDATATGIHTFDGAVNSATTFSNNAVNGQTVFNGTANFAGAFTVDDTTTVRINGTGATAFSSSGLTNNAVTTGLLSFGSTTGDATYTTTINGGGPIEITGASTTKTFTGLVGNTTDVGLITVAQAAEGTNTFEAAVVGVGGLTTETNGTSSTVFEAAVNFDTNAISIGNGTTVEFQTTLTSGAIDNAGTLTFSATAGTPTYTMTIDDVGTLNISGTADKTFDGTIGATTGGAITVTNTAATNFNATGAVNGTTFTSSGTPGVINFASTTTPNFSGLVTLAGITNIGNSFTATGGISNTGALDFQSIGPETYTMDIDGAGTIAVTGTGAMNFNGAIGAGTTVGAISIGSVAGVTTFGAAGSVSGASFVNNSPTNAVIFAGPTTFTGTATLITGNSNTQIVGPSFQAGDGSANSGILSNLSATLGFATATGDATYNTAIDGGVDIEIDGASTSKTFQQPIGAGTAVGDITIFSTNTGTTTFANITANGLAVQTGAGAITFGGTTNFTTAMSVADGATVDLSGTSFTGDINANTSGIVDFTSATGDATYTTAITGGAAIGLSGASTSKTITGAIDSTAAALTIAATNTGTTTFSGAVSVDSFTITALAGPTTVSGDLTMNTGAITIGDATVLNMGGDVIEGAGIGVVNTGTANFTSTTAALDYSTPINGIGSIGISGGVTKTFSGNIGTTTPVGAITLSGAGTNAIFTGTVVQAAALGAPLVAGPIVVPVGTTLTINTASFTAPEGIANAGTVLCNYGGGDATYTFDTTGNGVFTVSGGTTTDNKTFSGNIGTVGTPAGAFSVSSTVSTSPVNFSGDIYAASFTNAALSGTVSFTGPLTLTTTATVFSGTTVQFGNDLSATSLANAGTVTFNAAGTETYAMPITGAGTIEITSGTTGTKTFSAAIASNAINVRASNTAAVVLGSTGTSVGSVSFLQEAAAGPVTFAGDGSFTSVVTVNETINIAGNFTATGGIANAGTVNFMNADAATSKTYAMGITGAGAINVSQGPADNTKTFTAAIASTGAITIEDSNDGTTVFSSNVGAASFTNEVGAGITTFAGDVTLTGVANNAATLNLEGDFTSGGTLTNTGTLNMTGSGTQDLSGQAIDGSAITAGDINVSGGAGATTFGNIGSTFAVGDVAITSGNSGATTFAALQAASFTNAAGTGLATFGGATTISGVTTLNASANIADAFTATGGIINNAGTLGFTATGTQTYSMPITGADAMTVIGGTGATTKTFTGNIGILGTPIGALTVSTADANASVAFDAPSSVNAASISDGGSVGPVTFGGDVTVTNGITLTGSSTMSFTNGVTTNLAAGISIGSSATAVFNSTTDEDYAMVINGEGNLTLTSGAAGTTKTFSGIMGGSTALGTITMDATNLGDVTFGDVVIADAFATDALAGELTFSGNTTLSTTSAIINPGVVNIGANFTATNSPGITNTGTLNFISQAVGTNTYQMAINGAGAINVTQGVVGNGKIFTVAIGATTTVGDITIDDTHNGTTTFQQNVNAGSIDIEPGAGLTTFSGDVALTGTLTNAAIVSLAGDLSTVGTVTNTGTLNFTSPGTVDYTGQTIDGSGDISVFNGGAGTTKTFDAIGALGSIGDLTIDSTNVGATVFSNAVTAASFTSELNSGATTFNGAVNIAGTTTLGGNTNINDDFTATGNIINLAPVGTALTFGSANAETYAMTIDGPGAITLAGNGPYTFNADIGDSTEVGDVTISNAAVNVFNGDVVADTGYSLTASAGNTTFNGTATFPGGATIAAGATVNFANATTGTGAITGSSTATLIFSGVIPDTQTAAMTINGPLDLNLMGSADINFTQPIGTSTPIGAILVDNTNTGTSSFAGAVSAASFETETGAGNVTISGDLSLSGTITGVVAGIVGTGTDVTFGGAVTTTPSTNVLENNGTIHFNDTASVTYAVPITAAVTTVGAIDVDLGAAATTKTFSGSIGTTTLRAGAITIAETNPGAVTFSNTGFGIFADTFTSNTGAGPTTFLGPVALNNGVTVQSATVVNIGNTFSSGDIDNDGTINFNMAAGAVTYTQNIANGPAAFGLGAPFVDGDMNINGASDKTFSGDLSGTGTINFANESITGTTVFSGTVTGDKTLNIAPSTFAAGLVTFNNVLAGNTDVIVGANAVGATFTGGITGTTGSMTIAVGSSVTTLGADSAYTGDTTIGAGATLNILGAFASDITDLSGTANFSSATTETIATNVTFNNNAAILETSGAGAKTITGELNSNTGITGGFFNVNGSGMVTVDSESNFAGITTIAANAGLTIRNDYFSNVTLNAAASSTLTFNPLTDPGNPHLEYTQTISGGGAVFVTDTDATLRNTQFTSDQTYTGNTQITGTTLEIHAGFTGPISFGTAGIADFHSLSTQTYPSTVEITTTNGTLNISNVGAKTFQGAITGTGPVNITATGLDVTFSTTAKTYSGATSIGAGATLTVATSLTGATAIDATADGAGIIFDTSAGNQTYNGALSTSATTIPVSVLGGNTQIFSVDQTYSTVDTNVTGATTLQLEGSFASNTTLDTGSILRLAPTAPETYSMTISGAGSLEATTAQTSTLTGVSSFTGGTTLSGNSTLSIQNAFVSPTIANGTGSTVIFNRTPTTPATPYNGVISGGGNVTVSQSETFNGVNTYTGTTTIGTGATLTIGGSGSINTTSSFADSGEINFNSTAAQTMTMGITGTGDVTVTSGTVTYSNTAKNYSGTTTVTAGTLASSVSIPNSAITVASGATYTAAAATSVPSLGALTNNGTVVAAPVDPGVANGGLTIAGAYTQTAGATLNLEITPTYFSQIAAGAGTIIDGNLELTLAGGSYQKGKEYVIVTASSLTGNFAGIVESHAYDFTTAKVGNTIVLTVIDPIYILPIDVASTRGNLRRVIDYYYFDIIPDLFLVDTETDLELVATIAATELNASQFRRAMMMLSPLTQASMPNNALQRTTQMANLFNKKYAAVSEHTLAKNACNRQMLTYGTPETSFFVEPVGVFVNQKANGSIYLDSQQPYTSQTYGAGAGAIKVYNGEFIVEGAVGYTNSNLKWKDNFGHSQWSSLYVAPFFGFFKERYYANAMVMAAFNFYNTGREMNFASVNRTARARYNSYDLLIRLCVGGRLPLGNAVWFQPDGVLNYLGSLVDAYTEQGASELNLVVKQQTYNQLQPSFRARLIKEYYTKKCTFSPNIYVGWLANIPLGGAVITSRFQGAPSKQLFNIIGQKNTTNQLIVGGEYAMRKGETFNLTATFEADFLSQFEVYTGKVKLEWLF